MTVPLLNTQQSPAIGILGDGQLAKMLALAALNMGLTVHFWSNHEAPLVRSLGKVYTRTQSSFTDFCQESDVLLFEHEHVDPELLTVMQQDFAAKAPGLELLRLAADRLAEKALFRQLDIPHATGLDPAQPPAQFPVVFKSRLGGYDGRGQRICRTEQAWHEFAREHDLSQFSGERFMAFESECSLVSVVGAEQMESYDITQNRHENGILIESINQPDSPYWREASAYNRRIATATHYQGVFAVEYFIVEGKLVANEISPRVHNSGHWTLDGAKVCQFANHIRASLNWPIGQVASHGKLKMRNIIGQERPIELNSALQENSQVYLYGKEPRPGRKLGHINTFLYEDTNL